MTTRIYLDLLRAIKIKIEEKRAMARTQSAELERTNYRSFGWLGQRAKVKAYSEDIALIDEALAELRKGE